MYIYILYIYTKNYISADLFQSSSVLAYICNPPIPSNPAALQYLPIQHPANCNPPYCCRFPYCIISKARPGPQPAPSYPNSAPRLALKSVLSHNRNAK